MMKEQYTSPEVKLVSFVAAEPIAFSSDSNIPWVNGDDLFGSVARVESDWDVPVFFEWLQK